MCVFIYFKTNLDMLKVVTGYMSGFNATCLISRAYFFQPEPATTSPAPPPLPSHQPHLQPEAGLEDLAQLGLRGHHAAPAQRLEGLVEEGGVQVVQHRE